MTNFSIIQLASTRRRRGERVEGRERKRGERERRRERGVGEKWKGEREREGREGERRRERGRERGGEGKNMYCISNIVTSMGNRLNN